ncbi:hypothetical protein Syun_018790 [Stephania yunnanensis]|uniref:Uncharacterized protein n=1 Tax=Stephania yunnanensis TaxID=152371 RepID=A0AAP0IUG6_9MAGN
MVLALEQLQDFSPHNLVDPPYSKSDVHFRQTEEGVLYWFARLCELEKGEYMGCITTTPTEENLLGILIGLMQNNCVNSESLRRMTTYKIRYRVLQIINSASLKERKTQVEARKGKKKNGCSSIPQPIPSRSGSNCLPPHPSSMKTQVEARKGKKGISTTELVHVHALRLLQNRYLQWRYANAKAEATMNVQSHTVEEVVMVVETIDVVTEVVEKVAEGWRRTLFV